MAELISGPYRLLLRVAEVLGDVGDRSLAGLSYQVQLGFRAAPDLCRCGFADCDPTQIRQDGTRVIDEAPDGFHNVFRYALDDGESGMHGANQFTIRIITAKYSSAGSLRQRIRRSISPRHDADLFNVFEPLHFKGDPENVFNVVVSVNPRMTDMERPCGGGLALILPVYRDQIEAFLATWLDEIRNAPRSSEFERRDHRGHLLRWMPPSPAGQRGTNSS